MTMRLYFSFLRVQFFLVKTLLETFNFSENPVVKCNHKGRVIIKHVTLTWSAGSDGDNSSGKGNYVI